MRTVSLALAFCAWCIAGAAWAQSTNSNIGSWLLIKTIDPITDDARAVIALRQEGNALAIKCDKPGPIYVQVLFDKYVGEGRYGGKREVTIRFDSDAPFKESWVHDSSYAAQFEKTAADKFARRLVTAKKLAIQAYSYEYDSLVAVFVLDEDAKKAIATVYELCKAGSIE